MVRWMVCAVLVCLMTGCANFKAVSAFATETSKLTGTIGNEFSQLASLCVKQAELSIAINDSDDQTLKDCEHYKAAQGRLAGVTVDVLDNYAKALSALADGKSIDLSSHIEGLAAKAKNFKDQDGKALADDKQVAALSKVAQVLVDVVTSARREAAIRRLVEQTPNLKITGDILRSFFHVSPSAPIGHANAPYSNLIAIMTSAAASNDTSLRSPAFAEKEPIRTAELRLDLKATGALLAKRTLTAPDGVPARVVAAIDAWQAALTRFADDALDPDPKELFTRLDDLRSKAIAARDAIENRNN